MPRWEQYEVWALNGERWESVATFKDFDVASALARSRTDRVRLIHAVYDDGKRVEEDLLAELGATRPHP